MLYLDRLKLLEALDPYDMIREVYDYAHMMKIISSKYEKYPRHFLTTHKIACRTYNRLKIIYDEKLFQKTIRPEYNMDIGEFTFIYPSSTQEIKDEATMQHNCVSSYIDRVLNGVCHIIFMRHKINPNKAYITLEVRDNKIVQAKRAYNDPVSEKEQEIIDKWEKRIKNKILNSEEKIA